MCYPVDRIGSDSDVDGQSAKEGIHDTSSVYSHLTGLQDVSN